jgi:hypothetical protein
VFLLRVSPPIDLGAAFFHERVRRLDAVGGLEGPANRAEDTEAMKCQRLGKTLGKTTRRRLVQPFELPVDLAQRGLGLPFGRTVVGTLEPSSPGPALGL